MTTPRAPLICHYVADAVYEENGVLVIEDTKSRGTAADETFRLKAAMVEAQYGITIRHHGAEAKPRVVRSRRDELVPSRPNPVS